MKKKKTNLICVIFFFLLLSNYYQLLYPMTEAQMEWISNHPEFVESHFFYLDMETNVLIPYKWHYYDILFKKVRTMRRALKEALFNQQF